MPTASLLRSPPARRIVVSSSHPRHPAAEHHHTLCSPPNLTPPSPCLLLYQRAHRSLTSHTTAHPPTLQLSDFPTNRQVGKSKSWQVGKLASWQVGKRPRLSRLTPPLCIRPHPSPDSARPPVPYHSQLIPPPTIRRQGSARPLSIAPPVFPVLRPPNGTPTTPPPALALPRGKPRNHPPALTALCNHCTTQSPPCTRTRPPPIHPAPTRPARLHQRGETTT